MTEETRVVPPLCTLEFSLSTKGIKVGGETECREGLAAFIERLERLLPLLPESGDHLKDKSE